MLKDRKVLIEEEIHKLHDECSHMYLTAMITESSISPQYYTMKDRLTDLKHDLFMVNKLIAEGHE